MSRHSTTAAGLLWVLLATPAYSQHAPGVGALAPEVKPARWLNRDGLVSWETLSGRLLLVEKWATW